MCGAQLLRWQPASMAGQCGWTFWQAGLQLHCTACHKRRVYSACLGCNGLQAGGYAEAEEGGSGDASPRVPSELVDAMGAEIEALEADQQEGLNPDYLDLRGNSPERDLSD